MNEHPFGIQDDDFWLDPWKASEELVFEHVGRMQPAIVIDAPSTVELAGRATLPLPVLYSVAKQDASKFLFEDTAVLVALRHEDRAVFADMATEPYEGEPPTPGAGDGFVGRQFDLDVRERLGIPWQRGTYDVRVLLRDQVSNTATVQLSGGAEYEDPEVARFKEERRPPPAPVSPTPGAPLPSFRPGDEAPALPDGVGLQLSAPRVVELVDGARAVVRGSFRLPVREIERLPAVDPDGRQVPSGLEDTPEDGRRPTAIVPVSLLLTGSKDAAPLTIRLRVPVFDPLPPGDEAPPAVGYFAVDLLSMSGASRSSQTWFVYAAAGDVFSGPVPMAFVTEDEVTRSY